MRPYALIDLHCDTLTDCMYAGSNIIDTLDDPARTLSLTSIPKDIHWAQFFAVFVPDELRGEKAIRFFDDACANFDRQMRKFADRVSPCRNVADMERAWAAGKTRGLSERGKRQRVCWRPCRASGRRSVRASAP